MNAKRKLIAAARQTVKKALLPFFTWPAHCVLRWAGYYRGHAALPQANRILAALYGGIGNAVLATPMLEAIHRAFPWATLHVWCQAHPAAEICQAIPYVDRTLIQGKDPVSSDYDLFVANCVAPPLRASLLGLHSGAAVRAGEDPTTSHLGFLFTRYSVPDPSRHEVDRNLAILGSLGLRPSPTAPLILVRERHRAESREVIRENRLPDGPMIGLHPGSGPAQSFKRWGISKFAELARRLSVEYGATVLLLGGADEIGLAEAIADVGGHGHVLAGTLSLLGTAALIEQCEIFISNDSALMHIAAAVGTPTVGIFGPTRPEKSRPFGIGHVVVTAGMPCQPCYSMEGKIKCAGPLPCMEALSVEQVLAAAAGVLAELKLANRARPPYAPADVSPAHWESQPV